MCIVAQKNIRVYKYAKRTTMWLLLIIVLSLETPQKHKGSIQNFYTSEAECRSELDAATKALQLKNSQVSGTCTFRDYLTPNRTF